MAEIDFDDVFNFDEEPQLVEQPIQFKNAVKAFNKIILREIKEATTIDCWVAGGAVRDYFLGKPIQYDIDLFFKSKSDSDRVVSYLKTCGGEVTWESDNGMKIRYGKYVFDIVKKYFPSPQFTINQFDFTVSMFAVDGNRVYFGETSFVDLAKKQLMINQLPYPASTLRRAFKYHLKGFRICAGETRKLIEAIHNMEPELIFGSNRNNMPNELREGINNVLNDQSSGDSLFNGID